MITSNEARRAEAVKAAITEGLRGYKAERRHRCEVTADRLGDDLTRYPDAFDGQSRDAVALIRHILQDIAEQERRAR